MYGFTATISQNPHILKSRYGDIVYAEFHPNWSTNVDGAGRISLTPSSKLNEPIFMKLMLAR
jgi:hypothetical protein